MGPTLTINQANSISPDEFRSAIADSLSRELKQATGRRDYFQMRCRAYEEQYGLSSDDFVKAFESGAMGDEEDFFDWFGDKQLLDSWDRRVQILAGASLGTT